MSRPNLGRLIFYWIVVSLTVVSLRLTMLNIRHFETNHIATSTRAGAS